MKFMYRLSCLCLFTLLLSSCKERINYVLKLEHHPLQSDQLYDLAEVKQVLFDARELNLDSLEKQSRKTFLKGAEYLINKNEPSKAIRYLKNSILSYPQAKAYYELGNALYRSGGRASQKEALKAFQMAENLGYEPIAQCYYRMAVTHAALASEAKEGGRDDYNDYPILDNLRSALLAGFSDTLTIREEAAFDPWRNE